MTNNYLGNIITEVSIGTCRSPYSPDSKVTLKNESIAARIVPSVFFHYVRTTKSKKEPKIITDEIEKVGQLQDHYNLVLGEAAKNPDNLRLVANLCGVKSGNHLPIEIKVYGDQKYLRKLRNKGIPIVQPHAAPSNENCEVPNKKTKTAHFDIPKFWESYKTDQNAILNYRREPSPVGLASELLHHQEQALAWLWDFENPLSLFEEDPDRIVQFYKKVDDKNFINLISEVITDTPLFVRNYIVADDMGLGKTIQLIALLLKEKECSPDWYKKGPNLIVCPKTLIDNWEGQIDEHCVPGALDTFVLYGAKVFPNLQHRDVVITTYEQIMYNEAYFTQCNFNRVILDEAHKIRSSDKSFYKSIMNIKALSYIALTGTPINNYLYDLRSLAQFIRIPFIEDPGNFKIHIGSKKVVRNPKKLGLLSECFIIRRTKELEINGKPIVELPEKIIQIMRITLMGKEKEAYIELLQNYKQLLELKSGDKNYVISLLLSLRLRQCVNHYSLTENDIICTLIKIFQQPIPQVDAVWIENYKNALVYFLDLQRTGNCFECDEEMENPCVCYYCKSVFCRGCAVLKVDGSPCCVKCENLARHFTLPENYSIEAYPFYDLNNKDVDDLDSKASTIDLMAVTASEKMISILNILKSIDGKCVIFSQWKTMLDIYEMYLQDNGYNTVMLDGSLSKDKRQRNIQYFKTDDNCQIMLITLGLGTGLNLTCANNVIIADLWYNPFVMEQAIDRCYRIGQTKNVMVYKLICSDSIEGDTIEPMLEGKRSISNQVIINTQFKKIEIDYTKLLKREFERLNEWT